MALSFELDLDQYVLERNVVTILDVLSDIGGFAEVIAFSGGVVLSFLNYQNFNSYLAQKLFKMENRNKGPQKNENSRLMRTRVGNSILCFRDNLPRCCTFCCPQASAKKAMLRARLALEKEIDVVEMLRMHRYLREMFKKVYTEEEMAELQQRNDFIIIKEESEDEMGEQQNFMGVVKDD